MGQWGASSKVLQRVACATVAALAAVACGGGGDNKQQPTSTTIELTPTTDALTDGVLKIGTLLPQTGSQASLGPTMSAAAALAVRDVNAAGGVNGKPVELVKGDSGDASNSTATTSVETLLAAKVDAIVGPASSGVAGLVVDRVTTARLLLVSPANPLGEAPAGARYFHTAPGDELRARAAVDQLKAAKPAKPTKVAVVARKDPYGDRLSNATVAALDQASIAYTAVRYNTETEVFDEEIDKVVDADPDAVVLIGYTEIADIANGLARQGYGADDVNTIVLTDRLDTVGKNAKSGVLATAKGLAAEVAPDAKLLERLRTVDPAVTDTTYAAETYDAVALVAIAAAAARTDFSASVAAALAPVTNGPEQCTTVAACAEAVKAGKQVTYNGFGGTYRFDAKGAPQTGSFAVRVFGSDNKPDPAKTTYVRAGA